MLSKSRRSFFSALKTSTTILAVLASNCALQAATRTFDGGALATGTTLQTPANWSGDTRPNTGGDTAQWDGTVGGNLLLTWGGGWTAATNFLVTSSQTGSLSMTGTVSPLYLGTSFEVQNNAGAVSVGVGSGSFDVIFQATPLTFTNSSSNTVTFGTNIQGWQSAGGQARAIVFGGPGNWQIDGNYVNIPNNGLYSLTKEGAGTLTFNGSQNGRVSGAGTHNTLNAITITGGTLKFGAAAQMSSGTGTFGTYNTDITNNATFEWASSANQTLGGVISGTGALQQTGAGALTLSGSNTYTGSTTVTAGTLIVSGGGNVAGSTVVNGGMLAGTGTLQGIDLQSGAISPGTASTPLGTLQAVSLTLESTPSSFNFNLSASDDTSDLIALTDAFTGGSSTYTFNFTGGMAYQTYTLVTFGSTNFSDVSQFSSTGILGSFAIDGVSLTYTTVPEPSTAALLGGGLFVVMTFRRRSRSC